jgi:predicted HicB family RNase H-like nuclease
MAENPRNTRTPIRMDRTLHRLARACAKRDGRSLNQWLTWVIRQAVAAPAPKLPEPPTPPPAIG